MSTGAVGFRLLLWGTGIGSVSPLQGKDAGQSVATVQKKNLICGIHVFTIYGDNGVKGGDRCEPHPHFFFLMSNRSVWGVNFIYLLKKGWIEALFYPHRRCDLSQSVNYTLTLIDSTI